MKFTLTKLPNIEEELANRLIAVGIDDSKKLTEIESVKATKKIEKNSKMRFKMRSLNEFKKSLEGNTKELMLFN